MPTAKFLCGIARASSCDRRWPSLAAFSTLLVVGLSPVSHARADDQPAAVDLYGDPIPAGAALRLGTARYRGWGWGAPPLFTVDDKAFITMSGWHHLAVADVATGKRIRELDLGKQNFNRVCLSADRESVFTLGQEFDEAQGQNFQIIQHLDIVTGTVLATIRFTERFGVEKFAVTPDDRTIVTANGEGALRFWDVTTSEEVLSNKICQGRIDALAISPDGNLIAASAGDNVYVWAWTDVGEPQKIPVGRRVVSLAFSPDGAILAEGPDSEVGIVLRNVKSHKVLRTLSDSAMNQMLVTSLAFAADGKSLVAANPIGLVINHRVHVWDVATGMIRYAFETPGMRPSLVSISADGRYVAAGASDNGAIKLWDLRTGDLVGGDRPAHDSTIQSVHVSHDGLTAVTSGDDGTIRVWDATTGKQHHILRHTNWVRACALSGDGRLIASSSLDDTVRLWDVATGRELYRLPGHGKVGGIRAVAFSADQSRFASWGDDLYLRAWDVKTGKALLEKRVYPSEIEVSEPEEGEDASGGEGFRKLHLVQSTFSSDARLLILVGGESNSVFDVATGALKFTNESSEGLIVSPAFSPDGSRVATSAWGQSIKTKLADGRTGFSAGKSHFARVRDVATGAELLKVELPDQGAGPVAFSADGQRIAVADRWPARGSLLILDAKSGAKLAVIDNVPADARALSFSGDGKRLACGFGDGTALIWDLKIPEDK